MRWLWQSLERPWPADDGAWPRPVGVRLLGQVLARSLWQLIKLNLLFLGCLLPSLAFLGLSLFGVYGSVTFALAVVLALPLGGAVSAGLFVVANELRDEPGRLWDDFTRKFRETFRRALVPGICSAAFLYAQFHLWGLVLFDRAAIGAVNLALGVVSLVVFGMLAPYVFLQLAFVDLSSLLLVRNAVLIVFGNLPRSLMASVSGGAIGVVFVLFLPASLAALPLIVLIGVSLSWLLALMWVWPVFDNQFGVDETLRERRAEQLRPMGPAEAAKP